MKKIDAPQEKFQSALELVGESWLRKYVEKEESEENKSKAEYEVPIPHGEPPAIAKAYRMAREDLNGNQTDVIELPKWREKSLEFLRLGQIYDSIKDSVIIDPEGNQLNTSVKELYRERLRSESEYKSSRYELEVAAEYNEIGHTPAFVKEDESTSKTPDIQLIDLDPNVQIECKRCRKKSDNERKQANRANQLFENIQSQLPQKSHIVLIELERTPNKKEVENIEQELPANEEISQSRQLEVSVPFGNLTIIPLPFEEPIKHTNYDTKGFEVMTGVYEDIIEPVFSNYLDINKEFNEFGNSVLLFEARDRPATLLIRRLNFIAIKESTWGQDIYKRFQNQFTNVSEKFGEIPSILHIDFPSMNEGDSLQELELRNHVGRQLTLRPEVSGVVVSGLIHHPKFSEELISRRRFEIPNYQPKHELPEAYKPIDPETAKSVDTMMKNDVNKELLRDPEGSRKAISQQEGSLWFRFKPNENRPIKKEKFIFDIISTDDSKRMTLAITPEENLQLRRLDIELGCHVCNIDMSDIPELDPIRIFITWSSEELGLSVGHKTDDELRHSRSKTSVGDVELQDGVPELVDDVSES